jgi:hypothetical protein
MNNYNDLHKQRTGTSFKGYVLATYQDLVETFGLPTSNGDNYKVDVEWIVKTPHGIATVYNYKDGKAYLGESGLNPGQICEWHVGGKTPESYHWIKKQISDRQIQHIT